MAATPRRSAADVLFGSDTRPVTSTAADDSEFDTLLGELGLSGEVASRLKGWLSDRRANATTGSGESRIGKHGTPNRQPPGPRGKHGSVGFRQVGPSGAHGSEL